MTTIDFYFNARDRVEVACRLAGKALAQKMRMLIYAPRPDIAQAVDRMLWTAPAISFVPHCAAHDALAAETPVLIAMGAVDEAPAAAACDVLLNLGDECPPAFERHERLLEIVAQDDAARAAARERFRFYRDRGYAIRSHDLAKAGA